MKRSIQNTSGFSLPSVLVGVALMGISAAIVSQTVVNSRRTQKMSELKLAANKDQQAALEAVTERIKEFVLDKCSGARWGGSGLEVEKAFRMLPFNTAAGEGRSLQFTRSAASLEGHADLKERCKNPISNAPSGALGEHMRFCMEIFPTGSKHIDLRLFEFLVVPVDLASDEAVKCSVANGAAAGVKVTWQMYTQVLNSKVSGGLDGKTVLKESGVFLVSGETESYSGSCAISANRVGTTNQCAVNVSGLGRRPPTLFKNNVPLTGFNWERTDSTNYDAFKTTVPCETNLAHTFKAQSAAGSDFCVTPTSIPPSITYVVSTYKKYHNPDWVKCIFTLQFKVNGGTTWHTFSGNRHWSTGVVQTQITDAMGFLPDQCNVLTPRLFWSPGGPLSCATYYPPNWANKGYSISYSGNSTYSVLIWDQYRGVDPGIFVNLSIPAYKFRIDGYGSGSCL